MPKSHGKINLIMPIILIFSNLVGSFASNRAPVSQTPIANNDNFTLNINSQLIISDPGVLVNDSTPSKHPLSAIKLTDPSHGTLVFNRDGSFTYTPILNYSGTDSFTYKANDGQIDSNPAIVILSIFPVNDLAPQPGAPTQATSVPPQIGPLSFGITVTPLAPPNGATDVATSPGLSVHVTDANNNNLQVSFYGHQKTNIPAQNFTLAVLPDTQFYTVNTGGDAYFNAETTWIANNQIAQNIVFATHTGDITQNGDNDTDDSEWVIADTAMSILERDSSNPLDDVPYSINPGNHDSLGSVGGVLAHYDARFPVSRFASKPYYGGHYGTNNDHSYFLFSAGGMHFIMINLACTDSEPSSDVLTWASWLLKDDVSRRGIVVCHDAMDSNGAFSSVGQAVFNALKDNANWSLLLCGHAGNQVRMDQGTDGHSIYSLEADYEGYPNGGNGYIRLLQFQPANNQIQVMTYSPTLNGGAGSYNTDPDSQFIVPYAMQSPDFTLINTVIVPSGSDASVIWYGLENSTQYEWYAVARNLTNNSVGITQIFTTTANPSGTETPTMTSTPGPATSTPTPTPKPTYPPNVVFQENFDPVSESWTHFAAIGTDDWGPSYSYYHSPTTSYFSSEPATVKDDYLLTSSVLVPANAVLTFWHTYQMETGYDGSVIEISTDGGITFNDLGSLITTGMYNGTISNEFNNPVGGRSAWTGGTIGIWSQVVVNLSSYAGLNVIIRFRMTSDNGTAKFGWYIDDVSVTGSSSTQTATAALTSTIIPVSQTPTPTSTLTPTATFTPLPTSTSTPTPTNTPTYPIATSTSSPTPTVTSTPTPMSTATGTSTSIPTNTFTPTPSYTPTYTPLPTNTFTPTSSYTPTYTPLPTNTFTPTSSYTPTYTPLPTNTFTPTSSYTPTYTPLPTNTFTPTSSYTPTYTPLPTSTVVSYSIYLPLTQRALEGYFVSPNGSDTNDGSWTKPWRTIGKAASLVTAGDVVYIKEGVYKEFVIIRASGTELEPIKFLPYPGDHPVIDGINKDPGGNVGLVEIYGDYIYISGLEVRNSVLMGVYIYGNHDIVDKMYVHHCRENGILIKPRKIIDHTK